MSRTGKVFLILGVLIAAISGCGVLVILRLAQAKPDTPTTKVVIAFQNVAQRSQLTPDQVGLADWPRAVPTPIGAFAETVDVVGKLAVVPIYPGQPIISPMLVEKDQIRDTRSNAALLLEKGTVAKAMPVTIISSVADAIQPGDRVDVLATFRSPSATAISPAVAQRLLADVLVMQVGPWPAAGKAQSSGPASVITLQLKEQDALVLQYALEFASSLSLVLRPANDYEIPSLDPVTLEYINQRYGYKLNLR